MDLLKEELPQSTGRIRFEAYGPIESSNKARSQSSYLVSCVSGAGRRGLPNKEEYGNSPRRNPLSMSRRRPWPRAPLILSISQGAAILYKCTKASRRTLRHSAS